ncbi:MAG: hypothetical protein WCD44_00500 [Candidatus Babeliales bacterium]
MLLNKSIKKLILVSLLIVIPAQTMALSWPSFSNIKNNVGQFILNAKQSLKKYSITVAVAVGGCVATCAAALGFKKKENVAAIALGSCVAVYASKIYHQRKEAERIAKEDAKLDAVLAEQYSIEQEEQEQDVKIAEENWHPKLREEDIKKTLEEEITHLKKKLDVIVLRGKSLSQLEQIKNDIHRFSELTNDSGDYSELFISLLDAIEEAKKEEQNDAIAEKCCICYLNKIECSEKLEKFVRCPSGGIHPYSIHASCLNRSFQITGKCPVCRIRC